MTQDLKDLEPLAKAWLHERGAWGCTEMCQCKPCMEAKALLRLLGPSFPTSKAAHNELECQACESIRKVRASKGPVTCQTNQRKKPAKKTTKKKQPRKKKEA